MEFQFYMEKLISSAEFRDFKKENPSAFLCSGFFTVDKKPGAGAENQQHLDYFIPKLNKMVSFKLNQNPIEVVPVENFGYANNEKINPVSDNLGLNFDEIEGFVKDKMYEENINKKIEKLIWSLQNRDGANFLIGTVFISGLGMIKVSYNIDEKKLTDFEKKSFFDFVKVLKK